MPIFAIYRREADTCGNEDITGPIDYIEMACIEDAEREFPKGFLTGYSIKEVIVRHPASVKLRMKLKERR